VIVAISACILPARRAVAASVSSGLRAELRLQYRERMILRTIGAATHGRYLVVPPTDEAAPGLLVGFHGYAELAAAAIQRLQTIPGSSAWWLVAIQGLNRFYRRRSEDVVAGWMTREDRELAIADNITYVANVIDAVGLEWGARNPLVFVAFSQGAAMAYRAACASVRSVSGVILLGGDVPPELDRAALARIPAALIGRGSRDEWYTESKLDQDFQRLREAGVDVSVVPLDAGHDWTTAFADAAGSFLKRFQR
jgi:predicted esterase